MPISSYSTTPSNNNATPPNGFPEGMAPAGLNDGMRQVMADIRSWYETPQWINYGDTPTRTGNTTFTVAGDLTARYVAGLRIRCADSSTLYGSIASSSYSAPNTTVTVTLDSGNLSASLTAVALNPWSAANTFNSAAFGTLAFKSSVSTSDIADNAVTGAKIAMGSDARGDTLFYNGTDYARLAAGTAGQVLQTNGAGADPSWATLPTRVVLQQVRTSTGAVSTGTTTIPLDDTAPTSSEGTQFLSLAITPTSASSVLVIRAELNLSLSILGANIAAMFRDGSNVTVATQRSDVADSVHRVTLVASVSAGSTSSTTFTIRAGGNSASTITLNGQAGARLFGGNFLSYLEITEYAA